MTHPNMNFELVPLTDQEVADIAEAQAIYAAELPKMKVGQRARGAEAYHSTLAQILVAHGFEIRSAVSSQSADQPFELRARRINTAPTDGGPIQ